MATFALMFLVAIPSVAFAESSRSHKLTLGLAGGFVNVASQQYSQSGGVVTYLNLGQVSVSLSSVSLTYTLNAAVSGSTLAGPSLISPSSIVLGSSGTSFPPPPCSAS